jgi:hypothetical protein
MSFVVTADGGAWKGVDRAEIARAARILFEPGSHHEIRSLPSGRSRLVTPDRADLAADAAASVSDGPQGATVNGLNEINHAYLSGGVSKESSLANRARAMSMICDGVTRRLLEYLMSQSFHACRHLRATKDSRGPSALGFGPGLIFFLAMTASFSPSSLVCRVAQHLTRFRFSPSPFSL